MWSLGIGVWWSTAASLISSLLSKLKARSTYFENKTGTKVILQEIDGAELLEKASIVTTPTAYSDGILHSVKPSKSPYSDFTFIRGADLATRVNTSGNIESVGVDLPRIDYLGGCGSLLLEPEATNTATDSNDFTTGDIFVSSGRGISGVVRTSNQAISPDGTNNAWSIVDNNNGGFGNSYYRWTSLNVLTNTYNTLSLFVKKQGNNDWVYLRTLGFTDIGGVVFFNISNGTLGYTDSVLNPSIEDYGNGWYRISITFNTLDSSGIIQLALATSDGVNNITRDGTNGIYIYGLQAESHATRQYATSYIPTSGGTVNRPAPSTNYTFTGLTEGQLYTLGVSHVAGNTYTSSESTITHTIPLPASPYSEVIVSSGYLTELLACNSTDVTTVYWHDGDSVYPVSGDRVRTTEAFNVNPPDGFYRIADDGSVMEVLSGIVSDVTICQ